MGHMGGGGTCVIVHKGDEHMLDGAHECNMFNTVWIKLSNL